MSDARKHLKSIIAENGSDRVRAVMALARLEVETTDYAPPPVDTVPLMKDALVRIFRSAGQRMSAECMALAFPVTISNGGNNGHMAGPPPSGDSLD